MVFEQPGGGLIDRRADRRKLYEQLFTGLLVGQHPLDAADVALDTAQAVLQFNLNIRVKVGVFRRRECLSHILSDSSLCQIPAGGEEVLIPS